VKVSNERRQFMAMLGGASVASSWALAARREMRRLTQLKRISGAAVGLAHDSGGTLQSTAAGVTFARAALISGTCRGLRAQTGSAVPSAGIALSITERFLPVLLARAIRVPGGMPCKLAVVASYVLPPPPLPPPACRLPRE
jgi:hypothetical protein